MSAPDPRWHDVYASVTVEQVGVIQQHIFRITLDNEVYEYRISQSNMRKELGVMHGVVFDALIDHVDDNLLAV